MGQSWDGVSYATLKAIVENAADALFDLEAFFSPLHKAKNIAEGGRHGCIVGKVPRLCYDKSRHGAGYVVLEGHRALLDIAQFWVHLTEGAGREMSAETFRATRLFRSR
jgi:hypothetical protein